jgi:transcription elongation GreA/GreB family factor
MTLSLLIANDQWQEFDQAWKDMADTDGGIDEVLTALALAGKKNRMARCSAQLRAHVVSLALAERHADAAQLIGAGLQGGLSASEYGERLVEHAQSAWGEESWWESYTGAAGLVAGANDLREAWGKFSRLIAYQVGSHIFHAGGWGTGRVMDVSLPKSEIVVRFKDGFEDSFPMDGAVDIFLPLAANDLRALYYEEPEDTTKYARKEPLAVLRLVLERHYGRAKLVSVKSALAQIGIESSSWSAWWRKCKKQAEMSPDFRIAGGGTNPELRLLVEPADPSQELEGQMKHMLDLTEVIERAREVLTPTTSDAILDVIRDAIKERVGDEEQPQLDRVCAWLLLREIDEDTPEALLELIRAARNQEPEEGSDRTPLYEMLNELPGYKEQDQAVDVLKEACGDEWPEELLKNFQALAPGMIRRVIDDLVAEGRGADLSGHYSELIRRPLRAPHVLTYLAKAADKGSLGDSLPDNLEQANSLVNLATQLYSVRRQTPDDTRSHGRIVDLLAGGDSPLLERLFEGAESKDLRTAQLLIKRGVEESIDNLVATLIFRSGPLEEDDSRFWMDGSIWTTRAGLDGRIQELRVLKDERVPANEKALADAAEQGDLSENSEWDAALEEQRNLAGRISTLEGEVAMAQLLENAMIPDALACPGTVVRYTQDGLDGEQSIKILGPWDSTDDGSIVSYQAPLAKGMLGMQGGESTAIELPGGRIDIEVVSVELIENL